MVSVRFVGAWKIVQMTMPTIHCRVIEGQLFMPKTVVVFSEIVVMYARMVIETMVVRVLETQVLYGKNRMAEELVDHRANKFFNMVFFQKCAIFCNGKK